MGKDEGMSCELRNEWGRIGDSLVHMKESHAFNQAPVYVCWDTVSRRTFLKKVLLDAVESRNFADGLATIGHDSSELLHISEMVQCIFFFFFSVRKHQENVSFAVFKKK